MVEVLLFVIKETDIDMGKSVYISPDALKPEAYEDVLIKVKNPNTYEQRKYLYVVGYYADNHTWWTADGDDIHADLVEGWIHIPE